MKRASLIFMFCAVLLAFGAGWLARAYMPAGAFVPVDPVLRSQRHDYKYVSPLLTCGTWEEKGFDNFRRLRRDVENYVIDATAEGRAKQVGVYFRELKSGRGFGLNENAAFSPASLLKVPVMIAYLKSAEKNPELLTRDIPFGGGFDLDKIRNFSTANIISPGTSYKADDLLAAMIVNSDNNAIPLLEKNISPAALAEVFTDIGLPPVDDTPGKDFISPKSYSYFFRLLYNATYLSEEFSEKALGLLAKADFPQGLPSTVPAGITVAHKYGERSLSVNNVLQYRELHDCGIVYADNPYLLCIMTKGENFDDLLHVIQGVGSMIYSTFSRSQSAENGVQSH